ncbi:MAG: IS110 family transposase [Archaeoglobales archaeon]|nr:MAG: IS110 family transposase [Archaeoglobales archaeon]
MEVRIGDYPVCIGLDIHKKHSYAAVVDESGKIVEETRIKNTKETLEQFASKYRGAKAVIEATSNYRYIYDVLENYMEVKLAHPYKTRIIAEARIKNDRLDAKMLAHLLRANLIAESYVPPKEVRELRDLTRMRKALIEDRTRIKNRVHAILARNGIFDYPSPFTKKGMDYLKRIDISETDRKLLEINLSVIERINEEIKEIDRIIQEKAKVDGDALLLTTIPGISYYSALLIKAEIGDVNRFPNKFKLISYAGLCPSIKQSGNKEIKGHITKQVQECSDGS